MIQVTLFTSGNQEKIDHIKRDLETLQAEYPHTLQIVDIREADILQDEFGDKVPVLDVGIYRLQRVFNREDIRFAFEKVHQRLAEAEGKGNQVLIKRITSPLRMTKADRFSKWFSNHYMVILNAFSFLYVFLAFLAPMLMKMDVRGPARVIYKVYSPLCHQLAFRSFFLFGEQFYYPRELAGVEGVITYGQASGLSENDIAAARNFIGNEVMGYKTALCQRDVAIYGAILLFGILFVFTGKKIKPLPWYLWILLGLGPIGLDGFSQLLSQTGLGIFDWLPLRESTPLLRVLTGAFFGAATAWFGFPYLEESVQENRREMALKYAIVQQIDSETSAD
jgi:uncharacterized membrane protein